MVAVVAANVPFDPLSALRRVARRPAGVPVYVIVGGLAEGSFVSPAGRDGLRALLGDDRVLVLDDAGHSPHRTHHGPFMALVRQALGRSG
jgi:pimeloyl-ACP methyl ester carboxylesterase